MYVCIIMLSCVYVNLCNNIVKPKCPILRHVYISMKSHITIYSGMDNPYTHVGNTVYMHLLKWGSSPCPAQGFYFTYHCDRQEVASTASGQMQDNVILFWVIIPTFCSMSANKWCVHGASTHTHLWLVLCVFRGVLQLHAYIPIESSHTHVCVYFLGLEWFLPFSK